MKDFSNLLEKIIFTPSRNSKISIISQFFKNCKDPERGFVLAMLTGNLKIAKPEKEQKKYYMLTS